MLVTASSATKRYFFINLNNYKPSINLRSVAITAIRIHIKHPLFHSDRGFQYTSKQFYARLKKHHMKQSMSRAAHCIDNGPMEGFWGILKRETYYGKRFTSKTDLIDAIASYIHYYNMERIQRKLHLMTPVEYHESYYAAA